MAHSDGQNPAYARPNNTTWRTNALCANEPNKLDWDTAITADIDECKEFCDRCLVKTDCLEDAILNREPLGVWGGMSAAERKHEAEARGVPLPTFSGPHGTHTRYAKVGCRCYACREAHAMYERERAAGHSDC